MRRFLIDTDTASDDAVALVMELRNPEIEVKAITVATGDENALRLYRKLGYIEEWKRMAKKL